MPHSQDYKLNRAPFLRGGETSRAIMFDMLVALAFPIAFACYCYGLGVLWRVLFCGAVCYIADILCTMLAHRRAGVGDFSSLVTGSIFALLLPANVPFSVLLVGCLIAIFIAKQPFGGIGNNIFNPAAVAMALVTVVYAESIFLYPMPFGQEGISHSLAYTLKIGGIPSVSFGDMLVGNYCGPVGAGNQLVLVCCFIFLTLRRTVSARITVTYLITVAAIAFFFPRVDCSAWESIVYEMTSGYLFFAAVFMLTEPTTAPKHDLAKILYGLVAGILTMLFRHIGAYEQGVCFAILLTNALAFSLDRLALFVTDRRARA